MPREPSLRERMDANAAGSRARRFGEPRERVEQYRAKYGDALADDWVRGWDAEDRALREREAERASARDSPRGPLHERPEHQGT